MMRLIHPLITMAMIFAPQCSARISTSTFTETKGVSAPLLADDFGMAAGGLVKFDVDMDSTEPPSRCDGVMYHVSDCLRFWELFVVVFFFTLM